MKMQKITLVNEKYEIDYLKSRKESKEQTNDSDDIATCRKENEILKYKLKVVELKLNQKKDDSKFDLDLKFENTGLRSI